jgi:hypothetical protein
VLVVLALLAACKGNHADKHEDKHQDKPPPAPTYTVGPVCEAAVKKAASAPLDARPQILIDGCHVCGDWAPILAWNTLPKDGGPAHTTIEQAMTACRAWCDPNAKQRFLGTLDNARGTDTRTPWRLFGETCHAEFPEQRFVSGPLFALDRIARAVASKGGQVATDLAAIELPLPPLSPSGVGPVLPDVDGVTPKVGEIEITVLGEKVFVGRMPRAHLGAGGVAIELGKDGYPGADTEVAKLPDALKATIAGDAAATITVLAPHAMPAQSLVPIISAAATVAPVYLAGNAIEAPEGWILAAAIPVQLATSGDPVTVTPEMTVQQLAAAIVRHKGSRVVLRSP